MEMTGMKFDLNPETFTLQNMFAMELHKFSDVIGDITASATKELGIEKGIAEVADTWNAMKFTVIRYMKGTQERGYVLGTVDEIMQILDDNAMNLQSMSASRFVGPFLETVQKWEKSLSHIGEVVEVRTVKSYAVDVRMMTNSHFISSISHQLLSFFIQGLDGCAEEVDVLREYLHWWRHQGSVA